MSSEPQKETPVDLSRTSRKRVPWIAAVLFLLVAAVYLPVLKHDFIDFDDPDYVYENPNVQSGLSWENVKWAFTSGYANNWHPLTWLSHIVDAQLFGMNAGMHHATSALIHAINTALLFVVFRRMTGAVWRSALVAALFGLHPLHVESVAWIAERKDVLSTLFFLLTLLAYARYAEKAEVGLKGDVGLAGARPSKYGWYGLALLFFALGLMSKPMVVTLPFVLLLLDYWPLRRLSDLRLRTVTRLVLEKLPFMVLSVASCIVTMIVQAQEGNVASLDRIPADLRLANAMDSYFFYVLKMFWPTRLAVYYPLDPEIRGMVVGSVLFLLVVSIAVLAAGRKRPFLMMGWLWFLGTLVPVIGLVQVGTQAMADRYTYIPSIGIFIMIVWGIAGFAGVWIGSRLKRTAARAVLILALVVCGALTERQLGFWKNSATLFRHTLEVTENNSVAHLNVGAALVRERKYAEATAHFEEALRIRPGYPPAESNLGFVLALQGQFDEAILHYRMALARNPASRKIHYLLGNALMGKGDRSVAMAEYRTELELNPNHPLALNDVAWRLATDSEPAQRNGVEAVKLAERLCRATGFHEPQFIGTLAAAYAEAGRFDDAIKAAEKAKALASATGQMDLAEKNDHLLQLYQAGKPFHDQGP